MTRLSTKHFALKKYEVTQLMDVLTLSDGGSFGELALITNKNRQATVVTDEDTHFAVLNKVTYQKALGKAFQ